MSTHSESPSIFRVLLAARDLSEARQFYERLLDVPGRAVAPGRIYLDCGPVILGLLDFSGRSPDEVPRPTEAIYLATDALDSIHERARALGCTSNEFLHGDRGSPMGEIRTRPWGERSFYVVDPTGNTVCFVDRQTLFTGTPEQVERLSSPDRGG